MNAAHTQAAPADDAPTVLTRRRVYIMPTRHGMTFVLVLFVMLVGSVNYNNGLGYLLTFLLTGLALVSILHTYRNLAALRVHLRPAAPVFAGESAHFSLYLDNRGQHERNSLGFSYGDAHAAHGNGQSSVAHAALGSTMQRVALPVRTVRRGTLALGRVTIASRFPLGLFRAWSNVLTNVHGLVYPRPAGDRSLPASTDAPAHDSGVHARGSDDFAGLRRYQPGDSSRRIHWKVLARTQEIPVKQFSGDSLLSVRICLDDARQADLEARLSQLCLWVLEADARAHEYELRLPGITLGPATGAAHLSACLSALALHGEADV